MSNYLAVIDYEHLDNAVFLTAFAKSLAKHGNRKGIIIHGDSEYTERLIQTGMMREDARKRAIKDLNRRLVALFADNGVSTVGVNAFQKELVRFDHGSFKIDLNELHKIPTAPCLLISNLAVKDSENVPVPLPEMASLFKETLDNFEVVLFSKDEKDEFIFNKEKQEVSWNEADDHLIDESVPDEFSDYNKPVVLTSSSDFANWPELKQAVWLE